jgi:UPF0755 protein
MSKIRRDMPPSLTPRDGMRPRSPSEALEPGRAPQRPRGMRDRRQSRAVPGIVRLVSGVMTLLLVMMLSAGGLMLFLNHLSDRPGPLTAAQTVVIPKGASSNDIAERLEREGVISSHWAFMINYLAQNRFGRKETVLKHGEYLFKQGASIREVMDILSEGKSVLYKVTVPEGLTSQQIVERLNGEENLTGEVTPIPTEGTILPETYSIEKGMSRQELVESMQAKHRQVLEQAWEKRDPAIPLKSAEEAVVLASIIEKETGRADERERIAGVFTNRLLKSMPLQSDPTILYGLYGGAVQWGKPILQSEKETKNAHNTYQIKALPPTPICNPGRAAIEAALHPEKSGNLFFVADGNGGHIFSDTLKEHNAAVATWRKVEKEIRAKQDQQTKADPQAAAATADGAIPNPPAEAAPKAPGADAAQQPAAATAAAPAPAAQASTIPLPVRKPKK